MLMTNTNCGGMPLGIILTSDEETSTIKTGLQCLIDLIPDVAFYGRMKTEKKGPDVFMTDDSDSERL